MLFFVNFWNMHLNYYIYYHFICIVCIEPCTYFTSNYCWWDRDREREREREGGREVHPQENKTKSMSQRFVRSTPKKINTIRWAKEPLASFLCLHLLMERNKEKGDSDVLNFQPYVYFSILQPPTWPANFQCHTR